MNEPNEKEFDVICTEAMVKMLTVFGELPEEHQTVLVTLNILNNLNYNLVVNIVDDIELKDPAMTKSEARRKIFQGFFADINRRLDVLDTKEDAKKVKPSMSTR